MNRHTSLCCLHEGQTARVVHISENASMRRRLQDIGLIEGTKVRCIRKSPAGDPVAYGIRGAVIALRAEQACDVTVEL